MNEILIYIGSVAITLWGIGHIISIKSIVNGFGKISDDNRRIITMEWIAEGLTLCFIGLLVLSIKILTGPESIVSTYVYLISAMMLLVLAGLSLFTGARTSIVPMKICPIVKLVVAVLFFQGSGIY
jgi:hypothetical protein